VIFGPIELVVVVIGAVVAVPLLRRGPRRGWILLAVYGAAFLAAGAIPMPVGHYVRLGMILVYPVLLFGVPELLLGQTLSESAFERQLGELLTSLTAPMRDWGSTQEQEANLGRQRVAQTSAAALARWRLLQVPSTRWQEAYRLAGDYLEAVRTAATVPGVRGVEASERGDKLVAEYLAAWQRATGRRP
jgi:hypothetical protein